MQLRFTFPETFSGVPAKSEYGIHYRPRRKHIIRQRSAVIDPLLAIRAKRAWNALKPADKTLIQPSLDAAHAELQTILDTGQAAPTSSKRELLFVNSTLLNDTATMVKAATAAVAQSAHLGCDVPIDINGELLGFGKYQILDPGWIEAAVVWLENFYATPPPFGDTDPIPLGLPDNVTLALSGDWGTGTFDNPSNPSLKIANLIAALQPDVTVHLGDVYYAGSASQETNNLVTPWPSGVAATLTLNSNHEMYPVAQHYFGTALASPKFAMQGGRSIFLLENSNWIVVGLDTAYFSDKVSLYMHGTIDPTQTAMLARVAAKGKKVILLSHHNALCEDGSQDQYTSALFNSVINAMGGVKPAFWYWGHVHCAAVYKTSAAQGVACRCIGHGALPWGKASALASPNVEWYEYRLAGDHNDPVRVYNGFATLTLDGSSATETFYDETGGKAWTSTAS